MGGNRSQSARSCGRHYRHNRDGFFSGANKLRIVETLLESYPVLIVNHGLSRMDGNARSLKR